MKTLQERLGLHLDSRVSLIRRLAGTDFHVTFNDKKTTCIMFGTSAAGCKCISVNDNEIMWSNRVKHLGNVIDCDLSDVDNYNSKKGHFIASVNWFVSYFSGQVPLDCYIRLFQTYCSSHYGSVLWQLNGRGFSSFCISWNKGVRRVLGIPYKTHRPYCFIGTYY